MYIHFSEKALGLSNLEKHFHRAWVILWTKCILVTPNTELSVTVSGRRPPILKLRRKVSTCLQAAPNCTSFPSLRSLSPTVVSEPPVMLFLKVVIPGPQPRPRSTGAIPGYKASNLNFFKHASQGCFMQVKIKESHHSKHSYNMTSQKENYSTANSLLQVGFRMSFSNTTYTNSWYVSNWSFSSLCPYSLTKILMDLNIKPNNVTCVGYLRWQPS